MIFDNDTPLDSNLIKLARELKKLTNDSPVVKITENNWILSVPASWMKIGTINVSFYKLHKKPFRVWWDVTVQELQDDENRELYSHFVSSFETPVFDTDFSDVSHVINSLLLLKYINEGIPSEVVDYLAKKSMQTGMELAIKSIGKETSLILSIEHMKILGIEEQRGRITGRKFGL